MTDDELKRLLAANSAETRQHFEETADRLTEANRQHFDAAIESTKHEFVRIAEENRRYFDVAMESNGHEIRLIAEKVIRLDEKLDQKTATLEQKIEQTATETQAMIKFSHAELDRRMRALEVSQRTLE